jgi:hypothetical protein
MGIFGQIQGPVRGVIQQLVNDKDLRVIVTYKKYTGREWSDAAEANVSTFEETTGINVVRLSHTSKSSWVFPGKIQVGEQLYLFDFRDAPAGMSQKDEILNEMEHTQKIKQIDPIFGLAVAVTVEGGGSGV